MPFEFRIPMNECTDQTPCPISNPRIAPLSSISRPLVNEFNGESSLDMSYGVSLCTSQPERILFPSSPPSTPVTVSTSQDNARGVPLPNASIFRAGLPSQSGVRSVGSNPSFSTPVISRQPTSVPVLEPKRRTEPIVPSENLVIQMLRFLLSSLGIFQHALSEMAKEVEMILLQQQNLSVMEDLSSRSPPPTLASMLNTSEDSSLSRPLFGAFPDDGTPERRQRHVQLGGTMEKVEVEKAARRLPRDTATLYDRVTLSRQETDGGVLMPANR